MTPEGRKCEPRGKGNVYPKKEGMGLQKVRKCEPRGRGICIQKRGNGTQ